MISLRLGELTDFSCGMGRGGSKHKERCSTCAYRGIDFVGDRTGKRRKQQHKRVGSAAKDEEKGLRYKGDGVCVCVQNF